MSPRASAKLGTADLPEGDPTEEGPAVVDRVRPVRARPRRPRGVPRRSRRGPAARAARRQRHPPPPSRCITGSAARACSAAAAVSPRFIVRSARLVWSTAAVHGPSSPRTSASAPAAASTAPAGSPTFSRAWAGDWRAGSATCGSDRSQAVRARQGTRPGRPGRTEQHRDHPGQPRVAGARPEPRQQLPGLGSLRRSTTNIAFISDITNAARRAVPRAPAAAASREPRRRPRPPGRSGEHARRGSSRRARDGEQLDEGAAVAVGERVAQFVGEVDLLDGDRVDRRELVAVRQAGAVAVRVRGRPGPPGRARLALLAGAAELRRPNSRTVSSIR